MNDWSNPLFDRRGISEVTLTAQELLQPLDSVLRDLSLSLKLGFEEERPFTFVKARWYDALEQRTAEDAKSASC